MNLKEAYDNLFIDPLFAFIQAPDGQILEPKDYFSNLGGLKLPIYSGSFNPLHNGHRTIYSSIINSQKTFEISIDRVGKSWLTYEELEKCLCQFQWYAPILITKHPRFVQKAGILRTFNPVFHVGADTATRILNDHGVAEIQGMRCEFVIYEREINGKICTIEDLKDKPIPINFSAGVLVDKKNIGLSSSKIRNASGSD